MSRSVIQPLSSSATAPELLSLLHQRLLVAEEQAEALIRDMGSLGVSRERLLEPVERDPIQNPVSPLNVCRVLGGEGQGTLWRQCEALVSRVCRMESLLQTLKLTTFRLETERELDPSHSAHLKEQLAALQQESEEEQLASRREVMRLREQLRQACLDREEAREEAHRLGEALEHATATKMEVALAAEELKMIKVQMSDKLTEMKEQVSQESARSFEAVRSHSELLQRVEEMERVVDVERRRAQVVQSNCQALRSEAQSARARLQEEEERARRLQEKCQQLQEQAGVKDSLVSELTNELKSARLALQKQQQENSRLMKDGGELRTVAIRVQGLNDQLESQCSELSSALRSLTVENARLQTEHQASIKAERSRVVKQIQEQDLILEAARRNIQGELQRALSEKVESELETLRNNHAQLVQRSTVAQETAATQREQLDCTIERLQWELKTTGIDREAIWRDRDRAKTEMCAVVTKLEGERSALESQLTEAKREAGTLSSAFTRQEEENRRLMGRLAAMEHQQHAQQRVEQMLKELTDSKNKIAYENGKLQMRVDQLEEELRAQRDAKEESVQQHKISTVLENKFTQGRAELITLRKTCHKLEKQLKQARAGVAEGGVAALVAERDQAVREAQSLRGQLASLQDKLEPLRKVLDVARMDNKKLALSLEQAVLANSTLQGKLDMARDHHQNTIAQREAELHEARAEIGHLSERLDLFKHQMREDKNSLRKACQREVSELRKALDDSSARSGDLSRANRELREKVSELEKMVSNQRARIKDQKMQLRQHLESRAALGNSQRLKNMEAELKSLEAQKVTYRRKNHDQDQLIQQFRSETVSLQRELKRLSSSQEGELEAEREMRLVMQDKYQRLEESIRKLQEAKDEAEKKLRDVSLESQQICENLEEAHNWFRSTFDSLRNEAEQSASPGEERQVSRHRSPGSSKDGAHASSSRYNRKAECGGPTSEPDWQRWMSTLQRWETKRELARIAGGGNPGRTRTTTHSH